MALTEKEIRLARTLLHDLANPLLALRMNLESIHDDKDLPPAVRDVLAESLASAREFSFSLASLRDLCAMQEVEAAMAPVAARCAGLAIEVRESLRHCLNSDITIDIDGEDTVTMLPMERKQAFLVLRNLVSEAADHAVRQVVIRIAPAAGVAGASDMITVESDGSAPPPDLDLFAPEACYSPDARWNKLLRLTHARMTARRHHGEIAVDRSPLGGVRFTLAFPGAGA